MFCEFLCGKLLLELGSNLTCLPFSRKALFCYKSEIPDARLLPALFPRAFFRVTNSFVLCHRLSLSSPTTTKEGTRAQTSPAWQDAMLIFMAAPLWGFTLTGMDEKSNFQSNTGIALLSSVSLHIGRSGTVKNNPSLFSFVESLIVNSSEKKLFLCSVLCKRACIPPVVLYYFYKQTNKQDYVQLHTATILLEMGKTLPSQQRWELHKFYWTVSKDKFLLSRRWCR